MQEGIIYPKALQAGDKISLISPGFQVTAERLRMSLTRLDAMGFQSVVPKTLCNEDGYFAGHLEEKVNELHEAFVDPDVKAIMAVRGGYGSARLLPHLDYDLIRDNPKIIIGYSDITALLLGIHAQTGLVTFHGPSSGVPFTAFTRASFSQTLCEAETCIYENPTDVKNDLVPQYPTVTLQPGQAVGRLIGGNLSVICSLVGTAYLPDDWDDVILFIEDLNEEAHRVDRMLGQLQLAGILERLQGIVIGSFKNCRASAYRSYTVEQIITRFVEPLGIPAYTGAMIGHQDDIFTVPIGARVVLDADRCLFGLMEPAVTD